ncbi:unnamed protein product [Psylliodes chrysocephalus]|uniref:Uncharacterized protein n=1 Tax=Psylliodes chrysocephalus TaxID=3402493 RepID=A0A9P0G815_9CUCU|nr:unnamed protein product [Psylliodes chrysocephala]
MERVHSSSIDSEFDLYIKTNINYVISETWNLRDTRDEIFRSRELLKTIEDNLFPNNYKSLALENAKFIFDIMIEDFARWTIKKAILNIFDNCLDNMTELERYNVSKNLLRRKTDLYYLTFETHKYEITELIPESEDLQNKFLEITMENIDCSTRTFLNGLNQISQKIFSVKCQTIRLGSIECVGNSSGLWIDFNLIDKIASWYVNIQALLSEKGEEINNNISNLILLFQRDVEVVTIKRNLCKTIVVTFTLHNSCVSYSENYQHIIDGAKTLDILLDYSPEAEYLVRNIFPTIYRHKFMHKFNKRRKLSLVKMPKYDFACNSSSSNSISDTNSISETLIYCEDQFRMQNTISNSTASIINKHNILKDRDLNIKILSCDSEKYIKSKNDLLDSEGNNEHDIDEMDVFFESEEQLLSMAREFDVLRSVLNSDTNKNSSINISQIKPQKPLIEKASNTASTGQNVFTIFNRYNRNQNVSSLSNTPKITSIASSVFLPKVPVTTKIGKGEKAKKRNRHTSVGSINNGDSYNYDLSKSKYFSATKIKSNQLLKSKVKKNNKHKVEKFTCTDVSEYKLNRKITERNNKISFQFRNKLLKEKLDCIKNNYKPIKSIQKKNTKQDSIRDDSIASSAKYESSPDKCRAIDEDVDSVISFSLFRKNKNPKPIADSSDTEVGAVGQNILKPHVKMTRLNLSKNALTDNLKDKSISDHEISNNINIEDKPNNLCYEELSVKNIDIPYCSELKTKNLGANLPSSVSVWSKSTAVGNILCSKDFVGKYLLIICYHIDSPTIDPILLSEITQFSEKVEDFNKIGAAILICLDGPDIHFLNWKNQFENQEFLQKLEVPLIFEFEGNFMSTNFGVNLKNVHSEMKILMLVNNRGDVDYKSTFSICHEVNVVDSLKLLRHVQMCSTKT